MHRQSLRRRPGVRRNIVGDARLPVIAGPRPEVGGARASILLAERLRGAYDHMYSARIFADLDVMRQAGLMFTTPNEARLRADVLLFIGKDLTKIWPGLMARLSPAEIPPFDLARQPRKLLWVAPGRAAREVDELRSRSTRHFGFARDARGFARPCCRAGGKLRQKRAAQARRIRGRS